MPGRFTSASPTAWATSVNVPSPLFRYKWLKLPRALFVTYTSGQPSRLKSATDTAAPIEATSGMIGVSCASNVGP